MGHLSPRVTSGYRRDCNHYQWFVDPELEVVCLERSPKVSSWSRSISCTNPCLSPTREVTFQALNASFPLVHLGTLLCVTIFNHKNLEEKNLYLCVQFLFGFVKLWWWCQKPFFIIKLIDGWDTGFVFVFFYPATATSYNILTWMILICL